MGDSIIWHMQELYRILLELPVVRLCAREILSSLRVILWHGRAPQWVSRPKLNRRRRNLCGRQQRGRAAYYYQRYHLLPSPWCKILSKLYSATFHLVSIRRPECARPRAQQSQNTQTDIGGMIRCAQCSHIACARGRGLRRHSGADSHGQFSDSGVQRGGHGSAKQVRPGKYAGIPLACCRVNQNALETHYEKAESRQWTCDHQCTMSRQARGIWCGLGGGRPRSRGLEFWRPPKPAHDCPAAVNRRHRLVHPGAPLPNSSMKYPRRRSSRMQDSDIWRTPRSPGDCFCRSMSAPLVRQNQRLSCESAS